MENENKYGLIYGLTNKYFQGMVKIGATRNIDISRRMRVLGTAVPESFVCAFAYKVPLDTLFSVEHTLHDTFDYCRVPGSEFFKVDPAKVDTLLGKIGKFEPMRTAVQDAIDTEDARRKSPNMDFFAMGLNVGDSLYWAADTTIRCTITSNKKVEFGGKQQSLSMVTQHILGKPYAVQPSPYWQAADGTPLTNLYASYVQRLANERTMKQTRVAKLADDAITI